MTPLDVTALLRHPELLQSLDSLCLVTRGDPLNFRNIAQRVTAAVNQYGAVCDTHPENPFYLQVVQRSQDNYGQLTFLGAHLQGDPADLICLLEEIIKAAGSWAVHYLSCDLPAESVHLAAFRRTDFNIWARQKIYRTSNPADKKPQNAWRTWTSQDIRAMTCLYRSLVPSLFQTIEPMTRQASLGLVLYDSSQTLLGYADLDYGPKGIWVQPFLLPQVLDNQVLIDLVSSVPERFGRPVYVCARSYQPWLEELLNQTEFSQLPEQVLLVRYLIIRQQAPQLNTRSIFEPAANEGGIALPSIKGR